MKKLIWSLLITIMLLFIAACGKIKTDVKDQITEEGAKNFIITYESNGGTVIEGVTGEKDKLLVAPTPPTKEGNTFAGWYKEADFKNQWNFAEDKITGDTTLYAKWEALIINYKVTYESNGGTVIEGVTVEKEKLLVAPIPPTKEGYTFVGWYKEVDFKNQWNFGEEKVTRDTTLYAKWEIFLWTVYFESNEGTLVLPVKATHGTTIKSPDSPTKAGYTFEGWYADSRLTTKWNFDTDKITKETKIFAKWSMNQIPTYIVTFVSNVGTSINPVVVEEFSKCPEPVMPIYAGKVFKGWYSDANFSEVSKWNFTTKIVDTNVTLYAKWDIMDETYKVIYRSNGGSQVEEVIVVYGNLLKEPVEPTRADYIFKGWYKDPECKEVWNFEIDKVTNNITLYAYWEAIPKYRVKFNEIGIWDQVIRANSLITRPKDPTREGKIFKGWYKDPGCKEAWNFEIDKVTNNITLYSKWEVVYCVVWFCGVEGNNIAKQFILPNNLVSRPMNPIRQGYIFKGWYKDPGCKEAWNFEIDKVTNDMTIYAEWELAICKVSFDTNWGSEVASQTLYAYSLVSRPMNPIRQGYIFKGWYKDSGFKEVWNFETDKVTNDTTIYAKLQEDWMVEVEGGTFEMQDYYGQSNGEVLLSTFYMGKNEVTQLEFESVMGFNPSYYNYGGNYPVSRITWYDAVMYANELSKREMISPYYSISNVIKDDRGGIINATVSILGGRGYRIPTEAEWEYAAIGGNKSTSYDYKGYNSHLKLFPVGITVANELGLYDMVGNVAEWCWDWYGNYDIGAKINPKGPDNGIKRVIRGGSWISPLRSFKANVRQSWEPNSDLIDQGFRVVRTF